MMIRRCWLPFLIVALLVGCAQTQDDASAPQGRASASVEQSASAMQPEPESAPAPQSRPESPEEDDDELPEVAPEWIDLGENITLIDPPLGVEYSHQLDVFGEYLVRFHDENSVLRAERYDPLEMEALPQREIYRFDEPILSVQNRGDCLIVITESAAYRFDADWALAGRAELPLDLLDGELRMDYYGNSVLVNSALTEMVYRIESGLYVVGLDRDTPPRLLAEHPNISPAEELDVAVYIPVAFPSDSEVLVGVLGWEWWGDFATIRLDTGELRPLFAGSNPFGAMLYTAAEGALAVGAGDMVRFLDYSDSSLTDVPFIEKGDLQSYFYEGNYLFWGMRWFALRHLENGWENIFHTFHRVDYRQGVVEDLPFSVDADEVRIVWASENGDILFWYRTQYADWDSQAGYALARSTD